MVQFNPIGLEVELSQSTEPTVLLKLKKNTQEIRFALFRSNNTLLVKTGNCFFKVTKVIGLLL